MPGAKTHDMLTVVTGIGAMPVLWALLPDHNIAATVTFAGAHLVSGMAFSPDLDLASELYRRWGPLRVLWYPYREVIKHRSWVSHSLVIGPLFRLAYFLVASALLIILILWGLGHVITVESEQIKAALWLSVSDLWHNHFSMLVYFLAGFVTGGAVHSLADWLLEGEDPFHIPLFKPRLFRRLFRRGKQLHRRIRIVAPSIDIIRHHPPKRPRKRPPHDDEWGIF